jgi:starch synthase
MEQSSIRLLGLTLERVANFRSNPNIKNAGFYAALDRHYQVVGIVRPALSKAQEYLNRLRTIHPDRNYWRQHRNLNPWAFQQRTAQAEIQLHQQAAKYDLIVQLHTLCAPGLQPTKRHYVLHTDNVYLLSERYYAPWAPLRGHARSEWLRLERAVYQNAAYLFPRTNFLRRSLIEDYGCDPERVITVGYGANFVSHSIAEHRYDTQVALFVGFDFERKGGYDLLQAWKNVKRYLPKAQLWIVGPKQLYKQLPGVRWLGRVEDRQELGRLYSAATVFVMPSHFDPSPGVYLEAMGHGLACIGADQGAIPEIIRPGVNGCLVDMSDTDALSEALFKLLSDPGEAARLGQAAYRYVREGFTWDNVVARMAPYITRVVAEHNLAARV